MPNKPLPTTRPQILRAFDAYLARYKPLGPHAPASEDDIRRAELVRRAMEDEADVRTREVLGEHP